MHALDAKVTLDDNAAFRHEWSEYEATQERDEREEAAHAKGLQYVGLDGYVGIIANGAGLAMSTVDIVSQVGGEPANFLDIGGGANADVMANALEVINNDAEVKSIFINIFGGITKGEEVANGIVQALGRVSIEARSKQHRKGNVYEVHVEMYAPHGRLVVSREPHHVKERYARPDVRASVRDAFKAAEEQLRAFGDIQHGEVKPHAAAVRL